MAVSKCYESFDLLIEKGRRSRQGHRYTVQLRASPVGEAPAGFRHSFSDQPLRTALRGSAEVAWRDLSPQVPSGKTPEEIRRNFLDRVVVREMLLAEGAISDKMNERPDVGDRIRVVLRNLLLSKIRAEVASASPTTDADVKAYYDANVARYNSPQRIAIWRILVETREEALLTMRRNFPNYSPPASRRARGRLPRAAARSRH